MVGGRAYPKGYNTDTFRPEVQNVDAGTIISTGWIVSSLQISVVTLEYLRSKSKESTNK